MTADLLARVRALELVARRNVTSQYVGNYVTTVRGGGMEFHEARHYQAGDPERHIDWNMTARFDTPYVRTFLEEREREVVVAVDVSASMHAGWQERSKLETAIEVAATVGLSALDAGDRLGFVLFDEQVVQEAPPRGGAAQLQRLLRALVGHTPRRTRASDPRQAIHTIQAMPGRRQVIFLVSDFIDHDVPDDLRFLGDQHDVSLVHIHDPFEYAGPGPLRLLAASPEGDGSLRRAGTDVAGALPDMQAFLRATALRLGLTWVSLSTRDPVGRALAAFLHGKRPWSR